LTLRTLHFTLHTLDSRVCTLHFALYTPHFALYTFHVTPHALHFTLYILHSTLYALHFTLDTGHSTLYTPHFTLHALHFTPSTPHSTLYTPHLMPPCFWQPLSHANALSRILFKINLRPKTLKSGFSERGKRGECFGSTTAKLDDLRRFNAKTQDQNHPKPPVLCSFYLFQFGLNIELSKCLGCLWNQQCYSLNMFPKGFQSVWHLSPKSVDLSFVDHSSGNSCNTFV
jgi:hypothetical protein